jgi:branched-chain amino acid transport system permease protein
MLTFILQVLINGVLLGGIYALLSSGLSLYFGVARVANSAHAVFAVLASHLAYWLYTLCRIDPLVSLLHVVPILFIIGAICQRILMTPVMQQPPLTKVALTFFIAIGVENAMILCWKNIYRSISVPYSMISIPLGEISIPLIRLVTFLISIITLILLIAIMRYTKIGKAIRATADNREGAQICGININLIYMLTAGISFGLAGIGGVMLGLLFTFYPAVHTFWIGKLYTIVIFGGIGSIGGSFIAAFIIGFLDSFLGSFASIMWSSIVSWVILLLTLLLQRGGLFRK